MDINSCTKESGLTYYKVLLEITKSSFQFDSKLNTKKRFKEESVKKSAAAIEG